MFISAVKLNIIIWESLPRVATRGTTVSGTSASAPWRLLLGQYERFSYIIMKITIRSRHLSGPFNRLEYQKYQKSTFWYFILEILKADSAQHEFEVHSDRLRVPVSPKRETVSSSTYQEQLWIFWVRHLRAKWVEHQRPGHWGLHMTGYTLVINIG